jgi:hypothetical protein
MTFRKCGKWMGMAKTFPIIYTLGIGRALSMGMGTYLVYTLNNLCCNVRAIAPTPFVY